MHLLLVLASVSGPYATAYVVDNKLSPHAVIRSVGLDEAQWQGGFWGVRLDLCRNQTLPAMGGLMEGTNYTQFFRNFEIAAGLIEGRYRGAPFNDGDFYKLMEAASAVYATTKNEYYGRNLDRGIEVIAKAQREDGYIHTPVLIAQKNGETNVVPFSDRNQFEVYNMGHLLTAACVHHRATGKTNLLAVAIKAAGFLEKAFANPTAELARNSVCPSHYMGLVELYRETRDARYLRLARKFFEMRDLVARSGAGGDDNQDRLMFLKQEEAVGHAVRANYLFAGAADLFLETGEPAVLAMLQRVWTNVTEQKLYVTGGCGALYDGASPDGSREQKIITRIHQAYGRNYQIPNTTAHSETCANIGNVLWNWRMFLATGEARYMDMVELALYNSVLSGASLDGTNFFYTNPLRVTDPMPVNLRWPRQRVPFLNSFCCPPNLARTIAEANGYAYGRSRDAIWVNLYGSSRLDTRFENGERVSLHQTSEYPWNGKAEFRIQQCGQAPFALRLRIPGWAANARARLNFLPVKDTPNPGTFFEISRSWKPGDVLELEIPMSVQLLEANPLAEETVGQLALRRGPLVYCLESPDLPPGLRIMDLRIPRDADFVARYDQRLLGGVVVLDARMSAVVARPWTQQLYREFKPSDPIPVRTQFIPYFAWGNRGKSEMSVWIGRE